MVNQMNLLRSWSREKPGKWDLFGPKSIHLQQYNKHVGKNSFQIVYCK